MQKNKEWEEVTEFNELAKKLIDHYPGDLGHVDLDFIIAYKCTNKSKPEKKTKLYDMSGQGEPMAFTNTKKYFVTMFHDVWDTMDDKNRQLIVLDALSRIDKEKPESGKVAGYDLHEQAFMARTFGVDWQTRSDVPDILKENIRFIAEPITEQENDMSDNPESVNCNKKCPEAIELPFQKGFKIHEGSYVSFPPGTKFRIYVNIDPDDPNSDVEPHDVEYTGFGDMSGIIVDSISVRELDYSI